MMHMKCRTVPTGTLEEMVMVIVCPGSMRTESPDVLIEPSGLKLQAVSIPKVLVLLATPPSTN